ncbi:metal dependent phosphohydrolase [Seinonella peptonophila]|uniref:Metal dependent phosphohydrolase n=1 Tax=Seinonella peptonophila TaxID=112248 RepID=A0A1M4UU85_9BACL|nr:HD domain-containing protein [Seinonella peptonophila]SHE60245.1 metal dependent phosphohydrolase [Seinonella peptonophila]
MTQPLVDLSIKSTAVPTKLNAEQLSTYIHPDTPRYQHILGVVEEMKDLCIKLSIPSVHMKQLIQTAYLHDIGYSESLKITSFHPTDGAIFAQKQAFAKPIIAGVLFHTEAQRTWKLSPDIVNLYKQNHSYLDPIDHLYIELITYCDLHRSANGEHVTLEQRITDIVSRYGSQHQISQQMLYNMKYFIITCERVEQYLVHGLPDLAV